LLQIFEKEGVKYCGIISEPIDVGGERTAFYVKDILSGERKLLCDKKHRKDDVKIGRYFFKKQGIEFGIQVLKNCSNESIIIIDEIGPAELKGKGWYEVLDKFSTIQGNPMIWVVRKRMLEKVIHSFPNFNFMVCDIENCSPSELFMKLRK
jgi:nucleoside-triphosphatase THEP1